MSEVPKSLPEKAIPSHVDVAKKLVELLDFVDHDLTVTGGSDYSLDIIYGLGRLLAQRDLEFGVSYLGELESPRTDGFPEADRTWAVHHARKAIGLPPEPR